MNKMKSWEVVIKPASINVDYNNTLWEVVIYMYFESGKSAEVVAGRYSTPIEAGKAAEEMNNFYKYLTPTLKVN